jgi:hypothetical protein
MSLHPYFEGNNPVDFFDFHQKILLSHQVEGTCVFVFVRIDIFPIVPNDVKFKILGQVKYIFAGCKKFSIKRFCLSAKIFALAIRPLTLKKLSIFNFAIGYEFDNRNGHGKFYAPS